MLQVHNVSRSYGSRKVLREVNFSVKPGRMTGFVGSNGAGKTTAMRIILGVLTADSGTVTLNGKPLSADDRQLFGYMPEERGLYPKMRVAEQIVYLARLHGMSQGAAQRKTTGLLDRLGLGERADSTVESLSLGNQQRAQIAAALVHDPAVLILDEPFSGLDPLAVDTVVGVLKEHAASGAPVLFSSHQLEIVERLCDDVVVIADGSIRAAGSRDELRREHTGLRYEIEVGDDAGWVRGIHGVTVIELDAGYALFEVEQPARAQAVLHDAIDRGIVTRFAQQQPTLAQIFREVIK